MTQITTTTAYQDLPAGTLRIVCRRTGNGNLTIRDKAAGAVVFEYRMVDLPENTTVTLPTSTRTYEVIMAQGSVSWLLQPYSASGEPL